MSRTLKASLFVVHYRAHELLQSGKHDAGTGQLPSIEDHSLSQPKLKGSQPPWLLLWSAWLWRNAEMAFVIYLSIYQWATGPQGQISLRNAKGHLRMVSIRQAIWWRRVTVLLNLYVFLSPQCQMHYFPIGAAKTTKQLKDIKSSQNGPN